MNHFIIGLELTKLNHKIIRALERELITSVDKNLSATTARIICYITENSPHQDIFQKDIEQFMGLKRASVSLILNTMEKNDFIVRQSVASDGRYKKILPTPKSQQYHQRIVQAFDTVEARMKLGLQELGVLQQALAIIDNNLED